MTRYRAITPANVHLIPPGTRVRFNYGAGMGEELATVTGHQTNRWGTELTAETDKGTHETISGISRIGIGTYIVDEQILANFFADAPPIKTR